MPRLKADAVEVFVYRRIGRAVEFLALRRHPSRRLAGVWQPITGKIERGESALSERAGVGRLIEDVAEYCGGNQNRSSSAVVPGLLQHFVEPRAQFRDRR